MDPCPADNPNDSDYDGVCDSVDPCPLDNPDDSDGDGICDSADDCPFDAPDDTDQDGLCDSVDPCPFDSPNDTDEDGVCDSDDPCPVDSPDDTDSDGICDSDDPCPTAAPGTCPVNTHNIDGVDETGVCGCEYVCTVVSTTDLFDNDGVDDNCDGRDGVIDACVYVSQVLGTAGGDGTQSAPLNTVQAAIDLAVQGHGSVCLAGETFAESILLPSGVELVGGFQAHAGFLPQANAITVLLPGLGTGEGRMSGTDCARQMRAAYDAIIHKKVVTQGGLAGAVRNHMHLMNVE